MTYRNKKTGSVINIESELNGGDWEKIKPSPRSSTKKVGDKNGTVRKPK